jgi:tRNA pseudouridine synthase 10
VGRSSRDPPPRGRCSREQLEECEKQLAQRQARVQARGLRVATGAEYALMKEGEISKQKHYRALCWAARELQQADEEKLNSVRELTIQQDTPVRVLHRRATLIRERVRLAVAKRLQ